MEEAVEICKLRLFLKLVAQLDSYDQIEPLPDIDFNIRAGNTLIGFTSLDEVQKALRKIDLFKTIVPSRYRGTRRNRRPRLSQIPRNADQARHGCASAFAN